MEARGKEIKHGNCSNVGSDLDSSFKIDIDDYFSNSLDSIEISSKEQSSNKINTIPETKVTPSNNYIQNNYSNFNPYTAYSNSNISPNNLHYSNQYANQYYPYSNQILNYTYPYNFPFLKNNMISNCYSYNYPLSMPPLNNIFSSSI